MGGREFWFRWSDGEGRRVVRGPDRAGRYLLSLSFLRAWSSKPLSRSVQSEYRGATAVSCGQAIRRSVYFRSSRNNVDLRRTEARWEIESRGMTGGRE